MKFNTLQEKNQFLNDFIFSMEENLSMTIFKLGDTMELYDDVEQDIPRLTKEIEILKMRISFLKSVLV